MNPRYLRREFLRKAAALGGALVFVPFAGKAGEVPGRTIDEPEVDKRPIRINPAFRINLFHDGSVELYTFQKPGSKVSYQFSGLEASLFLLLIGNKPLAFCIKDLAEKHSLGYSDCEAKLHTALDDFSRKGLIYYGDLMVVKKTEGIHE
jgi:hypothetical protein